MSTLTDRDDRVRLAGVFAFLLMTCGLSLAICVIVLGLVSRGERHGRHAAPAVPPPSSLAAGAAVVEARP